MTFFERCHSWHHRFCSRSKTFTFQSVECSQRFEDRVPSDHYDEEERSSDRGFIDDDPIIDQYEGSSDLNDDHLRQQTQKSETDPTAPHKRRLYSSGENDQEAAASSPSFQRGARTRIYSSPSPPPPPPNPYLDRNDFFGLNEEKPERTDDSDDPPDLLPDTQRMPIWDDDDDDDQEDENGDKVVVVEEEEETDLSPRYTVQQVKDLLNTQREYYQKQTSTKWKGKGQGKNGNAVSSQKTTPLLSPAPGVSPTRRKKKRTSNETKAGHSKKPRSQSSSSSSSSSKRRQSSTETSIRLSRSLSNNTVALGGNDRRGGDDVVTPPVPPFTRTHLQPPPSMPLGPRQLVLPPPPPGSKVSSEELTATEVAEALEKLSKNRIYISDVGDLSVSAKADSMSNVQRLLVRKDSKWKDICKAITSPSEFFKLKGLSDQVRHYKKMSCCIGSIGREKQFYISYTIG